MLSKIKKIRSVISAIIIIWGIFTFSAFIMEESLQQITFANFTALDAENWNMLKSNIELMKKINKHLEILNKFILWIQPVAMFAYSDYVVATNNYIQTMQDTVIANAPQLYHNEKIKIKFFYKQIQKNKETYQLRNGRLIMTVDNEPATPVIEAICQIRHVGGLRYELIPIN